MRILLACAALMFWANPLSAHGDAPHEHGDVKLASAAPKPGAEPAHADSTSVKPAHDGHGAKDGHGAAHDAHGGGENPLAGDVGNIFWTVVIFVVLIVVLGKFAWGPLLSSLNAREKFIKDLIDNAERDRVAAQQLMADYELKVADAKEQVRQIVEEGRRDADRLKADIIAAAEKDAADIRLRTRRDLELARDAALKELFETGAKLATDVASKILQRDIRPEDNRRLVEEALSAYSRN